MSFLTGYVTGSRKTPCPEAAREAALRLRDNTLLYHELAIL